MLVPGIITIVEFPDNQKPIANAGADRTEILGLDQIILDGAGIDPDGTVVGFSWQQVDGPTQASLNNPLLKSVSISNLATGNYSFRLTVTDDQGATAFDEINLYLIPPETVEVIPFGGRWLYLDKGVRPVERWKVLEFDESNWSGGNGEFGYGDGDETTIVGFGPSSSKKFITTYFRKAINIQSPSAFDWFELGVKRDDGIVVYVNGVEVYRNNMPEGEVANETLALTSVADDGKLVILDSLGVGVFRNGLNQIAVEVHQDRENSSDLSFDLKLTAVTKNKVSVIRGPYLQMAAGNAVTLRWDTDIATDSRMETGINFGQYKSIIADPRVTTRHELRMNGFDPGQRYFYRFGSSLSTSDGINGDYFKTAPLPGAKGKIGIAVFGDCGSRTQSQSAVRDAYLKQVGADPADLMLLLGDNAYNNGTEEDYTSNFFKPYGSTILRNHIVFPAPGNHEYANQAARQTDKDIAYYDIFSVPSSGECGGVPSGTESYYSVDWGDVHLVSLDSYGYETGSLRLYDTLSPQVVWLKKDLELNQRKWTVVYWHHPPFTQGTYNSDVTNELVKIRQNFVRILERYGVDLVLCGHSHVYERSYLIRGHYGSEATFDLQKHAVGNSNGKYDGTPESCPYVIPSAKTSHGTVYVVSGSAGFAGNPLSGFPHDALPFADSDPGMVYLEFEENRMDSRFIRYDGITGDRFTIMKDAGINRSAEIHAGDSVVLTASWVGEYNWSDGSTKRSITVFPQESAIYKCSDFPNPCLKDEFSVKVINPFVTSLDLESREGISVYPVPAHQGENVTLNNKTGIPVRISLMDVRGVKLASYSVAGEIKISTDFLTPGIYYLVEESVLESAARRIIVID